MHTSCNVGSSEVSPEEEIKLKIKNSGMIFYTYTNMLYACVHILCIYCYACYSLML